MAALFSLGTGQQPDEEDHHRRQQDSGDPPGAAGGVVNNNNNRSLTSNGGLCLYRDEEIYGPKGLEIWQHQQQQQQQSYHRQRGSCSGGQHQAAPSLGIGYFSAAGASGVVDFRGGGAGAGPTTSTFNVFGDERSQSGVPTMMMMREVQQQGGFGCGVGVGVGGGGGINCQDCGNQAKKDCPHLRCRTCCKSRGYHCATHVKSTWVPAAKRRERHQHLASLQHKPRGGGDHGTAKRTRETPSSSSLAAAAPRLPAAPSASSSGLEVGQFPAEVNSAAVFRCVRLNAMDEGDDQIAYQTTLPIGGHLFKGILYDHGPEDSGGYSGGGGGGNSSGGTHHQHDHAYHHQLHEQQQFNLIEAMAATAASSSTAAANPDMLDPSLYTAPLNAFMSGTQFFQPPRS